MSKYDRLGMFLQEVNKERVELTYEKIENILDFHLPESAKKHRQWWENSLSHVQAKAWLDAGYKVREVNLGVNVVFELACSVSRKC